MKKTFYYRAGFPKLCAVKGIKVCREIFVFLTESHSVSQGFPNISSRGPCIDIFGPPWAKAKSLICEKQLINNCKQTIYLKKSVAVHS